MALLDTERGLLVIRVVYDGPALSGKTTTVRSLARILGRDATSGDEVAGRTLSFDWLDYTGGRFEGYPIRCQIISVPGQRLLRSRREFLLKDADAVVFVVDSRRSSLPASARRLASLRRWLGREPDPRPGVIVQANKRDAPDAATMDEVRSLLDGDGAVAVTESTATQGDGLRETFVLAVRLALDRVMALMTSATLAQGRPDVDSAGALLDALLQAERASEMRARRETSGHALSPADPSGPIGVEFAPAGGVVRPGARDDSRNSDEAPALRATPSRPRLPETAVPGGLIWPPVEGRIVLHEAMAAGHDLQSTDDGSWTSAGARWRLHSFREDVFLDLGAARSTLVDWARWHAGARASLSSQRCILAADAGHDTWRLWQAVRGEKSIRMALREALSRSDSDQTARELTRLGAAFIDGLKTWEARGVRCSIDTIGLAESGAVVYVGLAPRLAGGLDDAVDSEPDYFERLRREFAPVVSPEVAGPTLDVPQVLRRIGPIAAAQGLDPVGAVMAELLIGE